MRFHLIEDKVCIAPKILEKLWFQCPLASYARKIISVSYFKVSIMHAKFCTLHVIKWKIRLSKEFWVKWNSSAVYWATCTQITSLCFLIIYILCINFCAISSTRNWDQRIPKIPGKVLLQRHLWSNFHQKLKEINLC